MRIGIAAPFNPFVVKGYITNSATIKSINKTATSVNNIVIALLEAGEEVTVFTLDGSAENTYILQGDKLKVYCVACKSSSIIGRSFPNLSKLSHKITPYIEKEISYLNVLHAHWCYEYALAARSFKKVVPVFCTIRDIAPVIYKTMTIDGDIFRFINKMYWAYRIRVFNKVINDKHIHFIANSEYTRDYFMKHRSGVKVDLIYNSIEDNCILTQPSSNNVNSNPVFVTIATDIDDHRKNIYTLLEAFALFHNDYSNAELVIIGHYRKQSGIYLKAKNNNLLAGVTFKGMLNRDMLLQFIDNSTCLVHPAFEETFGNTLIESMSRCIPVIGGVNSGAVPIVLDNGDCGCLCDVGSKEVICSAMKRVAFDRQYSNAIVHKATDKIQKMYSNKVIGLRHIEVYRNVRSDTV